MRKPFPGRKNSTINAAAVITLFYLVISIAWITFSDRLLLFLVKDPSRLTRLQTYKGWAFVLSTSILIFFVIWKVINQLRLLDSRRLEMRRRANLRLRRALQARRTARLQMEAVLFHASDGIVVISKAQQILLVNRQAEKFFGAGLPCGSKQELNDLILARLLPQLGSLSEKQEATFDLEIIRTGTDDLILNAAAAPLFSRNRESTGMVVVLRDVSRQRRYDALRSRFIANAAHELKTPLTSIMGYSEILTELSALPEEAYEYAGIIHDQTLVLARIVDNLLDVGQVERGEFGIVQEEECDLSHILQTTLDQCRLGQRDRQFLLDVPVDRVPARCDSVRIAQVMENLLDNAVKFSPSGTLVRIAVLPGENHHQVCVSDQGIGMPPDVIPHIFDRFYRADLSDSAPVGLGLGLSIVQAIVTAHGGHTWVESEPGRGTTVCFTVPRSL